MSASKSSSDKSFPLVKENLAAKLKEAIVSGTLKQGEYFGAIASTRSTPRRVGCKENDDADDAT
jgi:hypothetical protein